MGRILKRVPMDFACPIGEIWESYLKKPCIAPPTGDGFQLWENTSEGSPISPVFKTLDELCEWAAENETVFASIKASKEEWMAQLGGSGRAVATIQLGNGVQLNIL